MKTKGFVERREEKKRERESPLPASRGEGTEGGLSLHDRQFDEAGLLRREPDALRCRTIVAWLRFSDILDERLRIAVVQREPARLNLHHQPVSGKKRVIRLGHTHAIRRNLSGLDRFRRLETLAIA